MNDGNEGQNAARPRERSQNRARTEGSSAESATAVDIAADVAEAAGRAAVRDMPADWWCPRDESRQRINCPECIAKVAVRAALAAMPPADEALRAEDDRSSPANPERWAGFQAGWAAGFAYARRHPEVATATEETA